MPKTEPWRVCGSCGCLLCKIGTKGSKKMMLEHRKICKDFSGGFPTKQISQDKVKSMNKCDCKQDGK